MTLPIVERLRDILHNGTPRCVAEAADTIEELVEALTKIANRTWSDWTVPRDIAREAIAKIDAVPKMHTNSGQDK